MDIEKNKIELNEKQKQKKKSKVERKSYMKEYYLRKRHQMSEGKFVKQEPKQPKVCPLKITRGTFKVDFS